MQKFSKSWLAVYKEVPQYRGSYIERETSNRNQEITSFDNWCQSSWGSKIRSTRQLLTPSTPQIRDNYVAFDKISSFLKVHIAEKLILESCNHVGRLVESGDVTWYICNFGRELGGAGIGFNGRRLQPLKAALLLTAHSQFSAALPSGRNDFDHIRAGGGAMAAMYLLTTLEFLCRVKRHYLRKDGTIKPQMPQQLRKKAGLQLGSERTSI